VIPAIVFDTEIVKAIPTKDQPREENIEYCQGWSDFKGMGISVLVAYDYADGRTRIYLEDNLPEFLILAGERIASGRGPVVSFNGLGFDNKLVQAVTGWSFPEHACYDILREARVAAGLDTGMAWQRGFKLDQLCDRTLGIRKTGTGAFAPVLWQRGKRGMVIDYCANDVWMTCQLWERVQLTLPLIGPEGPLTLRRWEAK
jgi:hypothetical protein